MRQTDRGLRKKLLFILNKEVLVLPIGILRRF